MSAQDSTRALDRLRTVLAASAVFVLGFAPFIAALVVDVSEGSQEDLNFLENVFLVALLLAPIIGGRVLKQRRLRSSLLVGFSLYAGILATHWGFSLFWSIAPKTGAEPFFALGWLAAGPLAVPILAAIVFWISGIGRAREAATDDTRGRSA